MFGFKSIAVATGAVCLMASSAFALPEQLNSAIDRASGSQARTVAATIHMDADGESILVRATEYNLGDKQFELLQPASVSSLNEVQRELWSDLTTEEEGDEGDSLLLEGQDLRDMIGTNAHLVRQEGDDAVFAFRPTTLGDDEDDEMLVGYVQGEIAVNGAGHIAWMRLYAPESFKPNFMVRIHEFDMRQNYTLDEGLNLPYTANIDQYVRVSAMGQNQEQRVMISFSDVEFAAQ